MPPPLVPAMLPVTNELVRSSVAALLLTMPPPRPLVVLSLTVLSISVAVAPGPFQIPPLSRSPKLAVTVVAGSVKRLRFAIPPAPKGLALLPLIVQPVKLSTPASILEMPPPPKFPFPALLLTMQVSKVAAPSFQRPPPKAATLLSRVVPESVSVPTFQRPPPSVTAELSLTMESESVKVAPTLLMMPPPGPLVRLLETVVPVSVAVAPGPFQIPPASALPKLLVMMPAVIVNVPRLAMAPEPEGVAVLPLSVQPFRSITPPEALEMAAAPKGPVAKFPVREQAVKLATPLLKRPPPVDAKLLSMISPVEVREPALKMPPPSSLATLPLMVLVEMVADPAGRKKGKPMAAEVAIAPPFVAVLPIRVESVSVREPAATLMAPPEPPPALLPVIVTPEMLRDSPTSTWKTRSMPAPSIVVAARPAPMMVTAPPPPAMSRSPVMAASSLAPAMVRVKVPAIRVMVSSPARALASMIAARSVQAIKPPAEQMPSPGLMSTASVPVVTVKFAPWAVSEVSKSVSEAVSVATTTTIAAKKEAAGRGRRPRAAARMRFRGRASRCMGRSSRKGAARLCRWRGVAGEVEGYDAREGGQRRERAPLRPGAGGGEGRRRCRRRG